ncbi:hypothetical protein AB0M20_39915, partial [Actinoplanes sp. NPDC051633]
IDLLEFIIKSKSVKIMQMLKLCLSGDIQELQRGLIAVADQPGQPWFAEGSHGTAEQRNEAFFAGYDGSLDACKL